MWWRLGVGWWMVIIGLPIWGVWKLVETFDSNNWVMILWGMPLMWVGYLILPLQLALLRRARTGGRATMTATFLKILQGWKRLPGWLARRFLFGGVVVGGVWMIVAGLVQLIGPQETRPAEGAAITLLLLAHLTSYCWLIQLRAILDMGYFLEIQEQLEPDLARGLNILGQRRNRYALRQAMTTLLYGHLFLIFLAAAWKPLMLLLPWLSWHSAGVLLNAWHDIFDPDGGMKVRQAQRQEQSDMAPIRLPTRR